MKNDNNDSLGVLGSLGSSGSSDNGLKNARNDRIKLFKVLYTLPWLLLIAGVLIGGVYWGRDQYEKGKKEIMTLAVINQVGEWHLNHNGKIDFQFLNTQSKSLISLDSTNYITFTTLTNIHQVFVTNYALREFIMTNYVNVSLVSVYTNYVTNYVNISGYKWNLIDEKIARNAGIDVERVINDKVSKSVGEVFFEYKVNIVNEEEKRRLEGLQAGVLRVVKEDIRDTFEAFEVYNKAIR